MERGGGRIMQGRAATPEGRKDPSLAGEMGKFSCSPSHYHRDGGKILLGNNKELEWVPTAFP